MTEAEWRASADPHPLLYFLGDRLSLRKRLLFGCACVRPVEGRIVDPLCRRALEEVEAFAEGRTTLEALLALDEAFEAAWSGPDKAVSDAELAASLLVNAWVDFGDGYGVVEHPIIYVADFAAAASPDPQAAAAAQAAWVRDLAGDPFRPGSFDPAWRTANTLSLARGIYGERAFERLPILADALEDAGCADRAALEHCRGGGPHVRGCWVLDLILGKP
jgi:hypothetical protein